MKDEYTSVGFDTLSEKPNSVKTGRSLSQVAEEESHSEMADFQ